MCIFPGPPGGLKEASIISSGAFTFSSIALAFVDDCNFDEELDFALNFELCFELDFELHLNTSSDFLDFFPPSVSCVPSV